MAVSFSVKVRDGDGPENGGRSGERIGEGRRSEVGWQSASALKGCALGGLRCLDFGVGDTEKWRGSGPHRDCEKGLSRVEKVQGGPKSISELRIQVLARELIYY